MMMVTIKERNGIMAIAQEIWHSVTDTPELAEYINATSYGISPVFTDGGFIHGIEVYRTRGTIGISAPFIMNANDGFKVCIDNVDGVLSDMSSDISDRTFRDRAEFTEWLTEVME